MRISKILLKHVSFSSLISTLKNFLLREIESRENICVFYTHTHVCIYFITIKSRLSPVEINLRHPCSRISSRSASNRSSSSRRPEPSSSFCRVFTHRVENFFRIRRAFGRCGLTKRTVPPLPPEEKLWITDGTRARGWPKAFV